MCFSLWLCCYQLSCFGLFVHVSIKLSLVSASAINFAFLDSEGSPSIYVFFILTLLSLLDDFLTEIALILRDLSDKIVAVSILLIQPAYPRCDWSTTLIIK